MSIELYLKRIEVQLRRTEAKVDKLLKEQGPAEWISEEEAMKLMGRSKKWFGRERMGTNKAPATLIIGEDWRRINGRTPEYKATSIDCRKRNKSGLSIFDQG